MKKSFMVFMASCMFIGAAQADLRTDYYDGLNEWEQFYPVIGDLKKQPFFRSTSTIVLGRLTEDSAATPQLVLRQVIKETIPHLIRSGRHFALVEGLDPVYRDLCDIPALKPLISTVNGNNFYEVKHIFSQPKLPQVEQARQKLPSRKISDENGPNRQSN